MLDAVVTDGTLQLRGATVNVGSGGVLVAIDNHTAFLPEKLEARLAWPVALETCRLQLRFFGTVAWARPGLVAIRAERHEFRTLPLKGPPSSERVSPPPDTLLRT